MKKIPLPRLDVFTSTDDYRPVMNRIYIDQKDGISSDAHILIKMNISDYFENLELADKKMIHRCAWFQMLWANQRICTETGIRCIFNNYECTFNYSEDGNYPDYMRILKPAYENAKTAKGLKEFALMPFLMERFSKLGRNSPVKFYLIEENQNIFIQSENYHGIIMPYISGLELSDLRFKF